MGNMDIYNAVSAVPDSAQKRITGGRLNGMTSTPCGAYES